jgi:hypothetical protein
MYEIKCLHCGNFLPINIKLAAEDLYDEYIGMEENFQGVTMSDKVYNPKRDLVDKDWEYLDRGTKKYKWRTDVKPPMGDEQGVSNVAELVGNHIIGKCGNCQHIVVGEISDPSALDTYHHDENKFNPDSAPAGAHANEIHENFDRVRSNVDVDVDKVINKIKKKYKSKGDHNESISE